MIPTGHAAQPAALSVEVMRDFAALRPIWDRLVLEGHATAYQTHGFCEAYFRMVEAQDGAEPALIVLRDGSGAVAALLPLSIGRMGPLRTARFIGGKQSNFNMPVYGPAAERLTPEMLRAALTDAGQKAGIDLYCLLSQPVEWQGLVNPLAKLMPEPAPSNGYKLQLEPDGEAVLKRQLSKDSRRKIRQKEQRLAGMGPVGYYKPQDEAEIRSAIAAFLALKAERFATQGIDDPFAAPAVRDFLIEAAIGRNSDTPALELHVLTMGDRLVAIFGGAVSGDRFSGLFTAFDASTEIARCSPGDILLNQMIRDCCDRGLSTFDLGVGEAHYKDKICDQTEVLVDSFLPATAIGRIGAWACRSKQALKRAVKTSVVGQRAIAILRGLKARR